ncbi:MAG: hypothetical protein WCB53_21260 [Terriglobales bacterium]
MPITVLLITVMPITVMPSQTTRIPIRITLMTAQITSTSPSSLSC